MRLDAPMKTRAGQISASIILSCALLFALAYILQSRAGRPENYPPFSSYRTLPEGSSVLFEALQKTPGMTADRNVQPLGTVHFSNAAILMLGCRPRHLSATKNRSTIWKNLPAQEIA